MRNQNCVVIAVQAITPVAFCYSAKELRLDAMAKAVQAVWLVSWLCFSIASYKMLRN